jgi:hypothetical protein
MQALYASFPDAAVLREKIEDTHTGYVRRNLPYFGKMFFSINCIDTTKNT